MLKEARYVFSDENCSLATTPRHRYCSLVDNGLYPGDPFLHSVGAYVSIAVDPITNFAVIAYYNSTAATSN